MFNTSIPAQASWNPATFADSQGFVLATNDNPRLTAYIWNPSSGLSASYQPSSDWGENPKGLSARKQGGYIAVCSNSRWSVYNFDAGSGFGSLNHDESLSNVRAVRFSPYGNTLAVATSSGVNLYDFTPVSGVGSLTQSVETGVTSITDVDFSPDGSHFLIVGQGGDVLEVYPVRNRKNVAPLGEGQVCSTPPRLAGENSGAGDKYGFCKVSGRCENGQYYYCYESDHKVYYGRIINGVPDSPSTINYGNFAQPFGLSFVPDKNLLVTTQSTAYNSYFSSGTDLRSFALSDNVSSINDENSVGSFAMQLGNSNLGGLGYNVAYMANYDAIVVANWDNYGNTHPLTTFTIASNGAFTEVTRPVASGTVNDGKLVDWL